MEDEVIICSVNYNQRKYISWINKLFSSSADETVVVAWCTHLYVKGWKVSEKKIAMISVRASQSSHQAGWMHCSALNGSDRPTLAFSLWILKLIISDIRRNFFLCLNNWLKNLNLIFAQFWILKQVVAHAEYQVLR